MEAIPHLKKQGTATQLIVQGKPLVILGGELHNSSASSLEYMAPIWPRLAAMNLNTVLATVSWELLEPEEGRFDFALVDGLIEGARKHDLKLVLLWFGSWKNGVSSYVPAWVKTDLDRFPRVGRKGGQRVEVLTPLSEANLQADAKAFAALLRHLRQVDQQAQTVVMVQVENEAGLLGDSRDRSPAAEEAFAKAVPEPLLQYLAKNADALVPELKTHWTGAGAKTAGSWADVFGDGADEAFMAWHIARYIGRVAAAGRAEYNLPTYANAWLVQSDADKPGGYPSGGPVSKMLDVWRAAAPSIDLLAPDIYLPDFKGVCAGYTRSGNPLFIPEASPSPDAGAKAFYAIGQHNAIGFCPFGIDSVKEDHPLRDAYGLLRPMLPLVAEAQGTGRMAAVLRAGAEEEQRVDLAGYRIEVHYKIHGRLAENAGAILIAMGENEFLVAGQGMEIGFSAASPGPRETRILSIDEGTFKDGRWVPGRRLNGDENGGGYRMYLVPGKPVVQRIKLYRHE